MDKEKEWKRKIEEQLLRDYFGLLPKPISSPELKKKKKEEEEEEDYVWLEECEDQLFDDYYYGGTFHKRKTATVEKQQFSNTFVGRFPSEVTKEDYYFHLDINPTQLQWNRISVASLDGCL